MANHRYQAIDNLCVSSRTKKSYPLILSYKKTLKQCCASKIKSIATSKANCYFAIGFDDNSSYADIICTPDQEFYSATTHTWISAKQLNIGDILLTKNNCGIAVTYIELVNEPLNVFIIEVKKTHTFFVGKYAVLTHNIILPLCIGISIPLGCTTGGTIGSFFGPVTCTIGIIAGSVIGTIIKIFNDDKILRYKLPHYNAISIDQTRKLIYNSRDHDNDTDAQAPGRPTEVDGYASPKKWDGKKVRNPEGGGY